MIGIAGAGAFGTALAVSLARDDRPVTLWGRDPEAVARMMADRMAPRLQGVTLPESLIPAADINAFAACDVILLATPAQALRGFLEDNRALLDGKALVACCKGIDLQTLTGPTDSIRNVTPNATAAMLTGPSFAADIAKGLPTALTLACRDTDRGRVLQQWLSTSNLRLYTTTDTIGADLGGALKNVIAIGCGVTIGAGLGDSARAALLTRGFAEMQRLSATLGADPVTLVGLSGLGDLTLTCTSDLSRNFRYGLALGAAEGFDQDTTVEGVATAQAALRIAEQNRLDLPVMRVIAALCSGETTVSEALETLLSRPLKDE